MKKVRLFLVALAVTMISFTAFSFCKQASKKGGEQTPEEIRKDTEAQVPQQEQGQQQEIKVSDSELETFAKVMQEIQEAQRQAQAGVDKAIEDNPDITGQRYQEIFQAKQQGSEVDISEKEEKAYSDIQQVIQAEQEKMDEKASSILEDHKMERQRYIEINGALRRNEELKQRLQQELTKQQQKQQQQQPQP